MLYRRAVSRHAAHPRGLAAGGRGVHGIRTGGIGCSPRMMAEQACGGGGDGSGGGGGECTTVFCRNASALQSCSKSMVALTTSNCGQIRRWRRPRGRPLVHGGGGGLQHGLQLGGLLARQRRVTAPVPLRTVSALGLHRHGWRGHCICLVLSPPRPSAPPLPCGSTAMGGEDTLALPLPRVFSLTFVAKAAPFASWHPLPSRLRQPHLPCAANRQLAPRLGGPGKPQRRRRRRRRDGLGLGRLVGDTT